MVDSKSAVGIKTGDSSVVIWYQVNGFTHTLFEKCFVAGSQIDPRFTGIVSILTYFPLDSGCEDYSFWTMWVRTLSNVLNPSSLTLSLHQNCKHPLMRLILCLLQSIQGFCNWSVPILTFLNYSLLLATNLINYGARCYNINN